MIDKYKQEVPEEEFADFSAVERGEAKFIVRYQPKKLNIFPDQNLVGKLVLLAGEGAG